MYDYTIRLMKNGALLGETTYQKFITVAGIENEIMHGSKLSIGGTPQAQSVACLAKQIMKADSVTVLFNGQPILEA